MPAMTEKPYCWYGDDIRSTIAAGGVKQIPDDEKDWPEPRDPHRVTRYRKDDSPYIVSYGRGWEVVRGRMAAVKEWFLEHGWESDIWIVEGLGEGESLVIHYAGFDDFGFRSGVPEDEVTAYIRW